MSDITIDDIKNQAHDAQQFALSAMEVNIQASKDGITYDSNIKIINNTTNKPDKITATQ